MKKDLKAKIIFYDEKGRTVAKNQFVDVWRIDDDEEGVKGICCKFEKGKTHIEVLIPDKLLEKLQ